MTLNRRLYSSTRTLASYVTSLAIWHTNHCPGAQFTRVTISTTSTAASSTSANAATNFTTDVSPEPAILQIQDNGNDLEEEGGEDFVDRYAALWVGSQRASATVATTVTTTAEAATTAMAVAATAAATAATTQPRRFDGRDIQATCTCGKLDFSVDKYPRFATRRPGHYLPRRIRFQCESEAARTAQRTKSSGKEAEGYWW